MTDKPNAYSLTPERFARARADIARRRKGLDTELAQLDADERTVAHIAERYSEASVEKEAEGISPPPTTGRKTKRPNTGRPYKHKEDVRIIAAKRGELEALAEALGRDYPGVLVEKAEELAPDQDGEARRFDESLPQRMEELAAVADIEPSSSEKPENFEPTPAALGKPESQESDMTNPGFRQSSSDLAQEPTAARELAEFDARRQRMQRAKPGIPVRGLTNDGPGHERFLDPTAFASRRPD